MMYILLYFQVLLSSWWVFFDFVCQYCFLSCVVFQYVSDCPELFQCHCLYFGDRFHRLFQYLCGILISCHHCFVVLIHVFFVVTIPVALVVGCKCIGFVCRIVLLFGVCVLVLNVLCKFWSLSDIRCH